MAVGTLDSALRPLLIRRGADLSLLPVFAVVYNLLQAWVNDVEPSEG